MALSVHCFLTPFLGDTAESVLSLHRGVAGWFSAADFFQNEGRLPIPNNHHGVFGNIWWRERAFRKYVNVNVRFQHLKR